jgi:ABC-type lipoprotein export system ATPase subunit/GNAT superfamily N-acetyltransferase
VKVDVVNEVDLARTARVMQLESIFDVPAVERARIEYHHTLPIEDRPWKVGLIVGPSGCGKSSIGRAMFGDRLITGYEWSPTAAVIDEFPADLSFQRIIELLNSVGFGSPPAWLRPFPTLSNGEQFRVTCARALAEGEGLVALDEFTSVVDRQVANVASHTIAKSVRRSNRQLVAITCHFDVADWLQPDWVFQPHTGVFEWRSVQPRPRVELAIHAVGREAWPLFSPHHYLSGHLQTTAKCFVAFVDDEPVAFVCHVHFPHATAKNIRMVARCVVLPDWQGLGIGIWITDWMAQRLHEEGWRARVVAAHPAAVNLLRTSPRWRTVGRPSTNVSLKQSKSSDAALRNRFDQVRTLATWRFEYTAPVGSSAQSSSSSSTGKSPNLPRTVTGPPRKRRGLARSQW